MQFATGYLSTKVCLGLGIPSENNAFGGIYLGIDGCRGFIIMADFYLLGYCYRGQGFIGNDNMII